MAALRRRIRRGARCALAGCNTPPAFQVSEQPAIRIGTVESITQDSVQNINTTAGTIGGALIGGGLGSLIGGGTGQTVATVVGAGGGGLPATSSPSAARHWCGGSGFATTMARSPPSSRRGAGPAHRRSRAGHPYRNRTAARVAGTPSWSDSWVRGSWMRSRVTHERPVKIRVLV